ncbi:alpha/beta fold hydrolase [Ferrimonas pelagia]|uniref:Alpha/beta fold hydrolase n=1 Tax=Ferrimonas pelagia TaxID=1177826 RepID=A0ABP9EWM2_9GAMM
MNYLLQGDGPVVVLLHGLFGDLDNLAGCARHLRQHGWQTLQISLRNHGDNPRQSSMTFAEMAHDLEQLRHQLALSKLYLLGHSLGGKVAMTYAQSHPEHCQALIVADIAPVAYQRRHDRVLEALSGLKPSRLRSRKHAQDHLLSAGIDLATAAFLLKNLKPDGNGGYRWQIQLDAITAAYPQLIDAVPELPPYIGPTLMLKGAESDYLLPAHQAEIKRRFPNAKAQILAGAGHWLHSQKPELFNRLTLQFFQRSREDVVSQ